MGSGGAPRAPTAPQPQPHSIVGGGFAQQHSMLQYPMPSIPGNAAAASVSGAYAPYALPPTPISRASALDLLATSQPYYPNVRETSQSYYRDLPESTGALPPIPSVRPPAGQTAAAPAAAPRTNAATSSTVLDAVAAAAAKATVLTPSRREGGGEPLRKRAALQEEL